MVISGYNILNWASQFLGGFLSQKFGPHKILGFSELTASIISSLIPFFALKGPEAVTCIRTIQGIFAVIFVRFVTGITFLAYS